MHQESNQMDTYLVVTRSKNSSGQQHIINNALENLNLDPNELRHKSTNYGMVRFTSLNFKFYIHIFLSFFTSIKIILNEIAWCTCLTTATMQYLCIDLTYSISFLYKVYMELKYFLYFSPNVYITRRLYIVLWLLLKIHLVKVVSWFSYLLRLIL